jgi:hypothetical protein
MDTGGFNKGIHSMQKSLTKLGVAIGVAFSVKKLIDFGKAAIDLGSDLQEVQNVVDVTFSTMSDKVDEFAKGAVDAAGLSETMAKKYMGTFGAMAKAFGFAEGEAFNMSASLTQLAGDVASFYNLTQDEAYTKLKSVFSGETETLKDLGIVMTQSALDSFAMAKGYMKTTKQMSEQEKVALRYAFVMDQLSAAQGDFMRTSDSWANQTRVLSLNFDSFKANIGQALINIFTPFLKVINQIVSKMAQLSQHFVAFSEMLVGKSTSGGGGSPGEVLEETASGYDDVADSAKNATKAQKQYLTGLDEIRTFQTPEGAGGSGTGGVGAFNPSDGEELNENISKTESVIDGIINKITNLIKSKNWEGLGAYISDGIIFTLDFISEKLAGFDWDGLGEDIGEFLRGIKWADIIESAFRLKFNIWKAIAKVWFGAFEAAPLETAVITGIAALKWSGLGKAVAISMLNSFKGAIKPMLASVGTFFAVNLPKIIPILSSALSALSPGMIGEIGLWIDRLLEGTVFDTSTWTGLPKQIHDFTMYLADEVGKGFYSVITGIGSWLTTVGRKLFNFDEAGQFFSVAGEWFGKIKEDFDNQDWLGIGKDILLGIGNGILGALVGLVEPIKDLFVWTYDEICNVFGINSPAKEMEPIGKYIFLGIVKGFEGMFSSFTTSISDFFKNYVAPWFTKEKWTESMEGIKDAFSDIWTGAVNVAIELLNKFIDFINENMNFKWDGFSVGGKEILPSGNMQLFTIPKIPMLATGAVIPPNAPFMAMLGDQKHGTNIEAPLDTIKQAVREVIGGGTGGQYSFTAQINRRTLFEEMIDEAKLRQSTSGRNPFELA